MATFPGATATQPTVTVGTPVPASHVDLAWQEIVAIEATLRGTTTLATAGANFVLKSGATGAIPLEIQGFAGQTADLIQIGSSALVSDRLQLSAGGKLTLPVATSTGGLSLGTGSNVWTGGTDLAFKPQSNSTSGIKFYQADGTTIYASHDTTNKRLGIGDATVPAAGLHLSAASAVTTAAFGIQFGNDATNLYRSAATTLKTDGSLNVGASLVFNDVTMSRTAADVLGFGSGDGIKLTLGTLELSGDTAVAAIKVTKSASGFLTDTWMTTTLIGAETLNRFKATAGGTLSWSEGTGTYTTLAVTTGNTGLTTNKDFTVSGNLAITGTSVFTGAITAGAVTANTLAVTLGATLSSTLSVAGAITLASGGSPKIRVGTSDDSYSGTDLIRVQTKELEIRSTAGKTRLVLTRPDGVRRFISIDNDDQIVIEAS